MTVEQEEYPDSPEDVEGQDDLQDDLTPDQEPVEEPDDSVDSDFVALDPEDDDEDYEPGDNEQGGE